MICCQKNSLKQKNIVTEFTFNYFTNIELCKNDWVVATHPKNLFMQFEYLSMLEKFAPDETNFVYVIISNFDDYAGVAYFQYKDFKPGDSLNYEKGGFNPWSNFKNFIAKRLKFSTLVSGNLLLTGEYGFYLKPEFSLKMPSVYTNVIDGTIAFLKSMKVNINLFFVKDFYQEQAEFEQKSQSFHFDFQPNMVMELREDWKDMDDYLAALMPKYRTRAKRAFKKGKELARVELDLEQIVLHEVRLFQLYKDVANNAGFNLFHLNEAYISNLKKSLGDDFKLIAYFFDNQLVGFCTTIKNYSELEAHCIGFDAAYNPTHQIYLNMLYDMIAVGIESKSHKIVFARTAMEIKSTVGAVGHNMFCYIRHSNSVINRILPKVIGFLNTNAPWEQRHPFGV